MNTAFVTGMGRSGTKLFAALLASCSGARAEHEYIGDREFWLLSWYLPADVYAEPYLKRVRERLDRSGDDRLFIDVNGRLQNCVGTLRSVFSPVAVFHLVRDPRDVVRSLYHRRVESNVHLAPRDRQGMRRWLDGDKFYRICWNWAQATQSLLDSDTRLIRFEDMVSDYAAFRRSVLEPLGLDLPESGWRRIAGTRVNETRSAAWRRLYARVKGKSFVAERLPPYAGWNEEQKRMFADVCGPVMERAGYGSGSPA